MNETAEALRRNAADHLEMNREMEERRKEREQDEALAVQLDKLIASGRARAWIAREAAVSEVFISGMVKNRRGNEDLCAAFRDWLAVYDPDAKLGVDALLPTPTSKAIQGICSDTMERGALAGLTGSFGIGKTFTLKAFCYSFAKKRNAAGAVYIPLRAVDSGQAGMLTRIAECLGVAPGGAYRNATVYEAVVERLGPGDLLICDECNRIFDRNANGLAMDFFRDINEDTGAGILLAGNPVFSERAFGKRSALGALVNRATHHNFPHSTAADVAVVLNHFGLEGGRARKLATDNATQAGENAGLRRLFQVYAKALSCAGAGAVSAALFEDTAKKMFGWQ
jgi:type II secretory pathway predicted ATPase ExeA